MTQFRLTKASGRFELLRDGKFLSCTRVAGKTNCIVRKLWKNETLFNGRLCHEFFKEFSMGCGNGGVSD